MREERPKREVRPRSDARSTKGGRNTKPGRSTAPARAKAFSAERPFKRDRPTRAARPIDIDPSRDPEPTQYRSAGASQGTARLQKLLAGAGVVSRRAAERLITEGRIRVNGRIVKELGAKANPHKDKIEVDGKRIVREKPVYYVLHKPREVVSTLSDPEGRDCIKDLIKDIPERVFPIGRLDYHTSGALLLTNDGELADALLKPKRDVPKTYLVKFAGNLGIPELDRLRKGVVLDDGYTTQPAELFVVRQEDKNCWVQITLREGKNRQIRRMGDSIGHTVRRLSRIAFADITTEGLRPGEHRPLRGRELEKLKKRYIKPADEDPRNRS
jgi:23S rRNA pseudouridine2605 synthase